MLRLESELVNRGRILVICCLVFVRFSVSAQATDIPPDSTLHLTLSDARELAVQYNYDARVSRINKDVARKELAEIVGSGLPQINAKGTFSKNLSIPKQIITTPTGEQQEFTFGSRYNMSGSVEATQLIFDGSYIVGVQSAKLYTRFVEVQDEQTQVEVLSLISQSYYNVLIAYENRKVLLSSLENIEKTLNETKARYEEGFLDPTDVDQIQVSANRVRTSINALENQINIAEKVLKFQLGLQLSQHVVLLDSLPSIVDKAVLQAEGGREFIISENREFQLAQLQVKLGDKSVKNERSAFYPKLTAYINYAQSSMRDDIHFWGGDKNWYETSAFGLNLSVPIFEGGQRFQRVSKAKLELEQYKIEQQRIRDALLLENSNAESNLQSSFSNYKDDKANMDLAWKVYQQTLLKYEEGVSSSTDLTQVYDQFLTAQNQYIRRSQELLLDYDTYEGLKTNYNLDEYK